MAITNGYTTLAAVKAILRITDGTDDTLLEGAIEAASRRVDSFCGRFFYQTSHTVSLYAFDEYRLPLVNDLVSITTLKTDDNGDGAFETTWTANTDYVLEPRDTALQSRPYRRVTAVGAKSFPLFTVPMLAGAQINGVWGWPSIPDDVVEATNLLSIRHFARYNAALGVVGFADMAIQVRAIDPDVRDLLNGYRNLGVA
jgi:hypothetical protein